MRLKDLRKAGQKRAVCFEWGGPETTVSRQGLASAAGAGAVWCGIQPTNKVYVTRESICSQRDVVVVLMDTTTTGIVFGKAYGTVQQEIDTKNTSVEFSEYMNFTLKNADLDTAGMTVKVDAVCSLDASCKQDTQPWKAARPITVGTSVDGTWTRSWTGNKKSKGFILSYALTVTVGGSSGTTKWGGDGQPGDGQYYVRCDNEVGTLAGCVVPGFTPTLVIPEKYNAARQFIGMVQASMASHPGWEGHGQPLHREADEAVARKNREAVCDGTFKPSASTPPPVQCDEFPFAKSKESGRQLGVTSGASCQRYSVISQTIDGKQHLSVTWPGLSQGKMPPANAKCARASMPKTQNEGVGGELGRKTVQWRLLGADPYWVDAGNK